MTKQLVFLVLLFAWVLLQGCPDEDLLGPYHVEKPQHARVPYDNAQGILGGDIVKVAGEYLIILRQNYLFSVHIKDGAKPTLRPTSIINTIHKGSKMGGSQKELYLSGRRIAVVGYSDRLQALEVGLFDLSPKGALKHISTNYLSGCIFYNQFQTLTHKSRMVGKQLILYVAEHAHGYTNVQWKNGWPTCGDSQDHAPRAPKAMMQSHWNGQTLSPWKSIRPRDIPSHAPLQPAKYGDSTHAIYQCDIFGTLLTCQTRAIKGGFASALYASKDAIYLWTTIDWQKSALVYRLPITQGQTSEITALKADGIPVDQYSLHEADGVLYAAVGSNTHMEPYYSLAHAGVHRLLRAPISDFSKSPSKRMQETHAAFPRTHSTTFHGRIKSRFVGRVHLYGFTSSYTDDPNSTKSLYLFDLDAKEQTILALKHDVEEIKISGDQVFVLGTSSSEETHQVSISAVSLNGQPAVKDTLSIDLTQNPPLKTLDPNPVIAVRSPLFYQRSKTSGGGLLALPLQYPRSDFRRFPYGTAQIIWFQVDEKMKLSKAGAVAASEQREKIPPEGECNEFCEESFYENTRAIFDGERIFALFGPGIVALTSDKGIIKEVARSNFFHHGYNTR